MVPRAGAGDGAAAGGAGLRRRAGGGVALRAPAFDRRRAGPYLLGGIAGVPLGVAALAVASPDLLRLAVGLLLVGYTAITLAAAARAAALARGRCRNRLGGGALGGFAGLRGRCR